MNRFVFFVSFVHFVVLSGLRAFARGVPLAGHSLRENYLTSRLTPWVHGRA